MLQCRAVARAAALIRGRGPAASTHGDVARVTRAIPHLAASLHPRSRLLGLAVQSSRLFATTRSTRAKKAKSTSSRVAGSKKAPAANKKKAAPKKKAKKPAPRKRKVLSEKAKAAAEKKKALLAFKELKAAALVEPKGKPDSAWTVYVSEKLQGKTGNVREGIKAVAAEFKNLSASEREHYNHVANQNKEANQKAYSTWVNSHTPLQIMSANAARQSLKRKIAQNKAPKVAARFLSPIKDDRQVKRPQSAFFKFNLARRESGDFQGIALGDAAKLITKEWKELSSSEKKKYEDLYLADKERYLREYERTYGKPPPSVAQEAS
ncbi:uncharacterized protein PV09_09354 [Verruconis gallopava]|uniref:HMG box domain-containing protein n=1 Tax=Verruconis gallopava TaxID=253628 RepID=A0A0D1X9Q2_9PEZI|nr:uncharacterized protein PV09_09354 [Verruconis gallopava]KIV98910.1 hypothetical protein PV09_09354 [Verruconis gallopava]